MKNVKVEDTRNFALVGHSGDGKTSVGEAILHCSGARPTLGLVDDGTSSLNYLPEEKERHTTISSSIYGFGWNDMHLTLVDTPGDSNFQADGQIAVRALDGAVVVLSAVGGAKVGTSRMWKHVKDLGVPAVAIVNGMDRERADFETAVSSLEEMGAKPAVVTIPIGAESSFSAVVDLIQMKAVGPDGTSEIPAEVAEDAASAREALTEAVAECDDALLETYLDAGELGTEDILRGLVSGARSHQILPVFAGAALAEIGIGPLLWAIREILPSPSERGEWPGEGVGDGVEATLSPAADAPFSGIVFKTVIDRYAGTLSLLRVISGTLKADMTVLDASSDQKERLGKLHLPEAGEQSDIPEAGPGDVVGLAKLKSVQTGHVLTAEKGGIKVAEIAIPQGVISYAIQAKSKGDEDKVYSSLGRMVLEDPTLHVGREASTGEFLLTGMGELHVRTAVQKLHREYGVEVDLQKPKVPYRETITARAEHVEGKLKKQTGGKGMFGVCYLTVEPRTRGEGIEFVDEIVGGAIPRNLIPAVEKGVMESCEAGPLAGFPVVDVRVRCTDGKHHPVDSNEMAFKLAASFGFKSAVAAARPTLLEPIMDVEVSAPADHVGDIMGDVSSRRGRVQTSEATGGTTVVQAQIPMSEMLEYASSLTSMTGGQGEFHMSFSRYEEVPAQIRDKIIAEAEAARAETS
jgi:elongation factor G